MGLKIGLNRLTAHIARADLNASVKRYARKSAREEAAQQVKDADLLKVMAEETDQDALYKAIHDSFGQSIIPKSTMRCGSRRRSGWTTST